MKQWNFWDSVQVGKDDECWPWLGSLREDGYGVVSPSAGVRILAHRFAFWIAGGEDPGEQLVCHSCDYPPCCNPAHLFLSDNAGNMADAAAKGRMKSWKLTPEQAEEIRAIHAAGKATALAARFGVTTNSIRDILRGKTHNRPKQAAVIQGKEAAKGQLDSGRRQGVQGTAISPRAGALRRLTQKRRAKRAYQAPRMTARIRYDGTHLKTTGEPNGMAFISGRMLREAEMLQPLVRRFGV